MGSLEKRVEKLETAMVGGPPGCKECGHGGGGPARIVFGGALKEGQVFEPEFCSECGEQLSFTMVFDKPNQRDKLDLELEELLDGRQRTLTESRNDTSIAELAERLERLEQLTK